MITPLQNIKLHLSNVTFESGVQQQLLCNQVVDFEGGKLGDETTAEYVMVDKTNLDMRHFRFVICYLLICLFFFFFLTIIKLR